MARTFCQFSRSVGEKSWYRWCSREQMWTPVWISDIFSLASTIAWATSLTYFVRLRVWRSLTNDSCWLSVKFFCNKKQTTLNQYKQHEWPGNYFSLIIMKNFNNKLKKIMHCSSYDRQEDINTDREIQKIQILSNINYYNTINFSITLLILLHERHHANS